MKFAIVFSRASIGMSAPLVTVEVHLSNGLPGLHIVGLPETAVKESRERVRSAIMNTHFKFPSKRITINLAPADLPKEGSRFDLPIALGILCASNQLPFERLQDFEFIGELGLSGDLRPTRAILPILLAVSQSKRTLVAPSKNEKQIIIIRDERVLLAHHLLEVCAFLKGESELIKCMQRSVIDELPSSLDLADVKGQATGKRALEIAAAGRHSLLFIGPPGTGKTMLASRLVTILPKLEDAQAIEVAAIASLSRDGFEAAAWKRVPFRSPHHSASGIALIGGGRPPKPGEISLAHGGILFLDELPEFNRHALECLREPLESGQVTISRASHQITFPANFQLIAAMNPCPCGYAGDTQIECECTQEQLRRYFSKISGPLLDRIDMQVNIARIPPQVLISGSNEISSTDIKERVVGARRLQLQRQGVYNANLSSTKLEEVCVISPETAQFSDKFMKKFNFSARVYHRLLKIARTIADLQGAETILEHHLAEAVQMRFLDHKNLIL